MDAEAGGVAQEIAEQAQTPRNQREARAALSFATAPFLLALAAWKVRRMEVDSGVE